MRERLAKNSRSSTRRGGSWLAVVAAGLAIAVGGVIAACELPTHADSYGTAEPVTSTTTSCSQGQKLCAEADGGGAVCSDLSTDTANCGACGQACGSTFECSFGACACPDGQTACDGVCSDTSQDKDNCGGCGKVCDSNAGFACVQSKCVLYCPPDSTNCMTECADLMTAQAHCSSCETACGTNESCQAGTCVACPVADQCPNPDAGPELCVNKQKSYANCGSCGKSCVNDQSCFLGNCACLPPAYTCPQLVGTASSPAGTLLCRTELDTRCGIFCTDCSLPQNRNNGAAGCQGGKCIAGTDAGATGTPVTL